MKPQGLVNKLASKLAGEDKSSVVTSQPTRIHDVEGSPSKDAGICFFFEHNDIDVYSGRVIDLDAWNYACKIGGINKAIIINKTDKKILPFDADMNIQIVDHFDQALLKGDITQIVTPWEKEDALSLWDFDHKTDWYLLGPALGWKEYFGNRQVTIPQKGQGASHAVHVATTVMFHRYKTLWL